MIAMLTTQGDGSEVKDVSSPKNGNRFTVPHTRALEARLREELLHLGRTNISSSIVIIILSVLTQVQVEYGQICHPYLKTVG